MTTLVIHTLICMDEELQVLFPGDTANVEQNNWLLGILHICSCVQPLLTEREIATVRMKEGCIDTAWPEPQVCKSVRAERSGSRWRRAKGQSALVMDKAIIGQHGSRQQRKSKMDAISGKISMIRRDNRNVHQVSSC